MPLRAQAYGSWLKNVQAPIAGVFFALMSFFPFPERKPNQALPHGALFYSLIPILTVPRICTPLP